MSYQYVEFEGVPLPLFDHNQSHDPMPSESTLLDSVGGAYDWMGSTRRAGRKQPINLKGVYFGQLEYWVDQTGDSIVDDTGDLLIFGDAQQMLQSYVTALMEKKGTRGQLWRKRLEDDVLEWKTARLLAVPWPRTVEDHAIKAEISCQFETAMEFWHAETVTSTSGSATDGVPLGLIVHNGGSQADDAIITITRTSGTITAFTLVGGDGTSITWAGSLGASDVLVIDCGLQTVRENGVDAYSGFTLPSAHTAAGWLPLSAGANAFSVTVTGGNATVDISHYNQFP